MYDTYVYSYVCKYTQYPYMYLCPENLNTPMLSIGFVVTELNGIKVYNYI